MVDEGAGPLREQMSAALTVLARGRTEFERLVEMESDYEFVTQLVEGLTKEQWCPIVFERVIVERMRRKAASNG